MPGPTAKGYGGNIRLMVGLNPDRTVISYQVLAAAETPGLGSNLSTPAFIARFKDQPAASVKVTKDGGKIEALTSATITSRAVCDAVADAAQRIDRIEGKETNGGRGATALPRAATGDKLCLMQVDFSSFFMFSTLGLLITFCLLITSGRFHDRVCSPGLV